MPSFELSKSIGGAPSNPSQKELIIFNVYSKVLLATEVRLHDSVLHPRRDNSTILELWKVLRTSFVIGAVVSFPILGLLVSLLSFPTSPVIDCSVINHVMTAAFPVPVPVVGGLRLSAVGIRT
jgi:hypothetical protein